MAKQLGARTAHRSVFRLVPVTYRIWLIYLGSRRVRQRAGYRCQFDLKTGKGSNPTANGLPPLQVIPNTIQVPAQPVAQGGGGDGGDGNPPPPPRNPVALPLTDGGDNSNPNPDTFYRLVVLDNHGMRMDDVSKGANGVATGLLGSGGNTESKVQNYNTRNFSEDVFPAVVFRVVVRKFVGNNQVNLTPGDLRVLWEIKDPEEELDQVPNGRARTFLRRFFSANSRDNNQDGDDNCSGMYGQAPLDRLRTASTTVSPQQAGVKASTVLFDAPYRNRPPIDQLAAPPGGGGGGGAPPANPLEDVLSHNLLNTALPAHDTMRALSELTGVQEQVGANPVTVGVSDVAFKPYPIGGDNFRFLLSLTDASGTDVRTTQESGRSVELKDHNNQAIPHPHCYTTGRFVMWRSINIRMLLRLNTTGRNVINWSRVQRRYDDAFIEIGRPQQFIRVTRNQWRRSLQRYFRGAGTWVPVAQINNNANYNAPVPYNVNFFPSFIHTPPGGVPAAYVPANGNPAAATAAGRLTQWRNELQRTHMEGSARRLIQDACGPPRNIQRPTRSTRQQDSEGFFVVQTKRFTPPTGGGTLLGAYVGEQQFFMEDRSASFIFLHELGHGLFLRHGQTTRVWRNFNWTYAPAAGAGFRVQPYSLSSNTFPLDHDAADIVECIMSYDTMTISTDFCAMCLMVLRYFDKVKLINRNRSRIARGWRQANVTEIRSMAGANNWGFFETPNNLARGSSMQVGTVAAFETVLNDTTFRSAKVLNTLQGMSYAIAPAGQGVTMANSGNAQLAHTVNATAGATTGAYTITFTDRGTTATMNITVV